MPTIHIARWLSANTIATSAELFSFVRRQVFDRQPNQRVAEQNNARDLSRFQSLRREGVVHDHGALTVSRDNDLGRRALGESCGDSRGHLRTAIRALVGVSLLAVSIRVLLPMRIDLPPRKLDSQRPGP
jgi:hypothetical protein